MFLFLLVSIAYNLERIAEILGGKDGGAPDGH
jgi:hypothetical protein